MELAAAVESDETLVARYLAGDERAFELLVERYEAAIRKLAFGYLRDRMLAEDIAQESFLVAHRRLGSLSRKQAFRSWLYRIAIRRSYDELRRRARRGELGGEEGEEKLRRTPAPGSPQAALEDRDRARRLATLIAQLPEKYRRPLILKDVQEMTYAEISALLGWPMGTVQIRIHRARLRLRRQLAILTGERN